jgi:hypothetical protein
MAVTSAAGGEENADGVAWRGVCACCDATDCTERRNDDAQRRTRLSHTAASCTGAFERAFRRLGRFGGRDSPTLARPVQTRNSSFSRSMAALWNAADLSAWELDDAAHAFYTTSGTGGLSSTPSWGETDKAAATHCSAKECTHVAELRADMARKTVEAIKPREELSVVPDFPFAPEEDPFWKVRGATAQSAPHARGVFSARGGRGRERPDTGPLMAVSFAAACACAAHHASARLRGARASAAAGARFIQHCAVRARRQLRCPRA